MKTFKAVMAILLIVPLLASCGKTSYKNTAELESKEFAEIPQDALPYLDDAISSTKSIFDSQYPDADKTFWIKYQQLQNEAKWVIHYFKANLEKNSIELSDKEINKATEAILDYYLTKVDEAYANFDNHLIPTDTKDLDIEYLSNNRFKDIRVKITYRCEEPDVVYQKSSRHTVGLTAPTSNHIPYFIDNSSSKRYMVLIIKPMAEIPSASYTFETSLPGRDYIENTKDKNKRDYAWCDFSKINVIFNTFDPSELGKYGDSWFGTPKNYNPTYVLISADGTNIEVDDSVSIK